MIPISFLHFGNCWKTIEPGRQNSAPEDLVFATPSGTPLSPKNLYNRVLAPACDRIKLPRVSWHSSRHTHATLLTEVGESIKTAQSLLGHSDLGTTLNTYSACNSGLATTCRDAGLRRVLFSNVLELEDSANAAGDSTD